MMCHKFYVYVWPLRTTKTLLRRQFITKFFNQYDRVTEKVKKVKILEKFNIAIE